MGKPQGIRVSRINDLEKYPCPKCSEKFRLKFNYLEHLRKHETGAIL